MMTATKLLSTKTEVLFKQLIQLFGDRTESKVRFSSIGDWKEVSRFHELTDEAIWSSISLSSSSERAVRTAAKSQLLTLRIQGCLSAKSLDSLKETLAGVGITNLRLYKSDSSSGYLAYLLLSEEVDVLKYAKCLSNYLTAQYQPNIEVAYPGDYAVLPLQKEFVWLNSQMKEVVRRENISLESALTMFMSELASNQICPSQLLKQIELKLITQINDSKQGDNAKGMSHSYLHREAQHQKLDQAAKAKSTDKSTIKSSELQQEATEEQSYTCVSTQSTLHSQPDQLAKTKNPNSDPTNEHLVAMRLSSVRSRSQETDRPHNYLSSGRSRFSPLPLPFTS